MTKKINIIIFAIFLFIFIAWSVIYFEYQFENAKLDHNSDLLGRSILLFREGSFDLGIANCEKMSCGKASCYILAYNYTLRFNSNASKNFCDKIPSFEKCNTGPVIAVFSKIYYENNFKKLEEESTKQLIETKKNCYRNIKN